MSSLATNFTESNEPNSKVCGVILDPLTFIPATLEDLSRGGARLSLETFVKLPQVFELSIPEEQAPRFALLRWQAGEQFGVQLISSNKFRELQSDLSTERVGRAAAEQSFPRSKLATDVSTTDRRGEDRLLPVKYNIDFQPALEDGARGRCLITFKIGNDSDIPAIHPFFCLPDLGFQATPVPLWTIQHMVSVRRFIRVCSIREYILLPRTEVGCCYLELGFSPRNGGLVRYTSNIEHPLAQLPNLHLSCQVGAGNFPSRRLQLVIPASHIAGIILDHAMIRASLIMSGSQSVKVDTTVNLTGAAHILR